jgi:putative aldouronate transport system permease protein
VRQNWELYLMFLPMAAFVIVFRYVPMGGIVIAFKDYSIFRGIWSSPWVGLAHFQSLFGSEVFRRALRNTIIISIGRLVFAFPVPIVFAILLDELRLRAYGRVVQTVSYLPHFISWPVAAGICFTFLSPVSGLVNGLLSQVINVRFDFLGDPRLFRGTLIGTHIWKSFGWSSIIYLAALSSVDVQLYEAAYMDGATRLQRIWHVTIPSILPVAVIMLILSVGYILDVGFEQVFVMINDMVMGVGETLDYYIYRVGLYQVSNFSYSTAVGLFKSVVGLLMILITNRVCKALSEGVGIW